MSQIPENPIVTGDPGLVSTAREAYDIVGTREGKWVRMRTGITDYADALQDAQMKQWGGPSVTFYLIKRTITTTEELIPLESLTEG